MSRMFFTNAVFNVDHYLVFSKCTVSSYALLFFILTVLPHFPIGIFQTCTEYPMHARTYPPPARARTNTHTDARVAYHFDVEMIVKITGKMIMREVLIIWNDKYQYSYDYWQNTQIYLCIYI